MKNLHLQKIVYLYLEPEGEAQTERYSLGEEELNLHGSDGLADWPWKQS